MAAARVVINRKFAPQLRKIVDARIGASARELRDVMKARLSFPYPPSSRPGESPHRRTGGLRKAVFASKIAQMDWAVGVRKVAPDPTRHPPADRSWLGLWMELGTGLHKAPFPPGTLGTAPPGRSGLTSVHPRPFIIPTLMIDGPRILNKNLASGR